MTRTLTLAMLGLCLTSLASGEDLLRNEEGGFTLDRWERYSSEPISDESKVWTVDEDGVLTCAGLPRGYIYTKQKYTDFALTLQWRWPPESRPGKGGVLCRMTGEHKVWPKCLEAQINVGSEGDFVGLVGYPLKGAAERLTTMDHDQFGKLTFLSKMKALAKPAGQWNNYEIRVKGEKATLRLNGELVNEATGCDVVAGPILLTAENDRIQFRNLQLTPLDD